MERGYSLLEMLVAIAVLIIAAGIGIPLAHGGIDRARASAAADYVAGRMAMARFEAVKRSAFVAIRFLQRGDDYWMQTFVDGNANGVLSADITLGVDRPISPEEQLAYHFPGIIFGIQPGVTGLDAGQPFDAGDPVQIGASTLLSFNPNGSSSSGTVFVCGRRASQYAVRVLGITGRTRIFRFNFGDLAWLPR